MKFTNFVIWLNNIYIFCNVLSINPSISPYLSIHSSLLPSIHSFFQPCIHPSPCLLSFQSSEIHVLNLWQVKFSKEIFEFQNIFNWRYFQHAPFDGMVMISSTYYIDLHVQRSKGKWQVCLILEFSPKMNFHALVPRYHWLIC